MEHLLNGDCVLTLNLFRFIEVGVQNGSHQHSYDHPDDTENDEEDEQRPKHVPPANDALITIPIQDQIGNDELKNKHRGDVGHQTPIVFSQEENSRFLILVGFLFLVLIFDDSKNR